MAKIITNELTRGKKSYTVDYYDLTGRRRKERFKTYGAAKARLGEVIAKRETGELRPRASDITFRELVNKWRLANWGSFRPNSRKNYDWLLNTYLLPYLGGMKLRTITLEVCEQFKDSTLKRAAASRNANRGGGQTTHKAVVLLRQIMSYGEKHNYCRNLARHVKSVRVESKQIEVLTGPELQKLFAAATGVWRPFLMVAALAGLRRGELLGLQWDDVEFGNKRLHVRRQIVRGAVAELKTNAAKRSIPMPDQLVSELKRWKLACPKGNMNLVFPNPDGEPWKHASQPLEQGLFPALRRAGLRKVNLHALRHGFASLLLSAGTGIKTVQTLMGHATVQMTLDTYAHLLPGDDAAVASTLAAKVWGGATGKEPVTFSEGRDVSPRSR